MSRSKPLSPAQERVRQTFLALRRMSGLTHQQVADRAGVKRGFVESKSCANSAIDIKDIELLAPALGVDEHVFLMEPLDAQRWVLDNAPSQAARGSVQGKLGSACTSTPTLRSMRFGRSSNDGVVVPFRKPRVA